MDKKEAVVKDVREDLGQLCKSLDALMLGLEGDKETLEFLQNMKRDTIKYVEQTCQTLEKI